MPGQCGGDGFECANLLASGFRRYNLGTGQLGHRAAAMNKSDLFRYKNLLLAKQHELTTGKSLAGSISAGGEPHGDPVDMAAEEAIATVQTRLKQTDSKLLRAIEDALTRIRQERFGTCEECGQPISKARLEAVPWARYCRDCKEQQGSQS